MRNPVKLLGISSGIFDGKRRLADSPQVKTHGITKGINVALVQNQSVALLKNNDRVTSDNSNAIPK